MDPLACPFCHRLVGDLGVHFRRSACDGPVERENPYLAWCFEDQDGMEME